MILRRIVICLTVSAATVFGVSNPSLAQEVQQAKSMMANQRLNQNANSNKCLDVFDAQTVNGAIVVQWDCHGRTNQQWVPRCVAPHACGFYYSLVNVNSGKCLEIAGGSRENKARVQQWDCNELPHQIWQPVQSSDRNDPVMYWNLGTDKVMAVWQASKANGASVIMWEPNGANDQWWYRV